MKFLVATDAWHPQVNGVVRTLGHVARQAPALGADLEFLTPNEFWTVPMPSYPEVRLALTGPGAIERGRDYSEMTSRGVSFWRDAHASADAACGHIVHCRPPCRRRHSRASAITSSGPARAAPASAPMSL